MSDPSSTYVSGNCNGNKLNRRIEILENLLAASGDDTTAKTNSLRQAIRRNKSDMADTTTKTLDVLRQVFQNDFNDEIKQVIDRHLRTTFTPAFENLRRNGHEVTDADIGKLCIAILDSAKPVFMESRNDEDTDEKHKCIPAYTTLLKHNLPELQVHTEISNLYDSEGNESDGSLLSYNSSLQNIPMNLSEKPKKRGRPKKIDLDIGRGGTPVMNGKQPISYTEAIKWDPTRLTVDTPFVLLSKVNKLIGFSSTRSHLLNKYPRLFRYIADEEDKIWLFQRNLTMRTSGKVFLTTLDVAMDIADMETSQIQSQNELNRICFTIPERLLEKIKSKMAAPFEQLKSRAASSQNSQHLQPNFIPAFSI